MVKVTLLGNDIDNNKVITISYKEWVNYSNKTGDIILYKNVPVFSYEIEDKYTKIEKVEPTRETIREFVTRRKNVSCAVSGCHKAGLHIGNYCNKHLEKAWRVMRKRDISLVELKALLEKRRLERNEK